MIYTHALNRGVAELVVRPTCLALVAPLFHGVRLTRFSIVWNGVTHECKGLAPPLTMRVRLQTCRVKVFQGSIEIAGTSAMKPLAFLLGITAFFLAANAHAQTVSKGDRVIVVVDEASVVLQGKVLTRVKRGEALTVDRDQVDPGGTNFIPIGADIDGTITSAWISREHVRVVGLGERYMSFILGIFIHLLVIASIVLMVIFIYRSILNDSDPTERLIRGASVGTGLLTYCAARAYGFSIPDLLASAITTVGPVQFGFIGAAVPAATGAFVAGICIRMMNDNATIGTRATLLIATFMFTMFADVYATLAGEISGNAGRYGLPNATFVLGLMLWTIFRYTQKRRKCSFCGNDLTLNAKRCSKCGSAA